VTALARGGRGGRTQGEPLPAPRSGEALERLLHPIPLAALAVLLVNDHVLKATYPGWLSGKLSDVAVMVLLPFLLLALADVGCLAVPRLPAPGRRATIACVAMAVALFTLIEITPVGADTYRWGLAVAQWPIRTGLALLGAETIPELVPVRLTSDVTDLLTLPAAGVILLVNAGWRRS
jgi:hypothetical protein